MRDVLIAECAARKAEAPLLVVDEAAEVEEAAAAAVAGAVVERSWVHK